jgi:uncharacterized Tic20 family protein
MERNFDRSGRGPEGGQGSEARKWASACHLIALIGLIGNGVGFVLGPLIVWLVKREEDPFIDEQGKESLNFQITMIIAAIISLILALFVIGFFLLVAVGVLMVVFPVIAGVKAAAGEHYRYPFTIRFLK